MDIMYWYMVGRSYSQLNTLSTTILYAFVIWWCAMDHWYVHFVYYYCVIFGYQGNIMVVPIIKMIGMTMGLTLWGVTNLLAGWMTGR